jgi:tRNA dimethylallyltransferase
MATTDIKPLVVIAGPTASGKTSLAVRIAKRFDGEIICADSRTIYRGMNIGTAKPSFEEQAAVPHWGLDLVEPSEVFTAADFKRYALEAIADIRARGKVPLLVGGTGLYLDAVLLDYAFGPPADPGRRDNLMNMSLEDLVSYCNKNNIPVPENSRNKRYVVRAIEQNSNIPQRREEPIANTFAVSITTDRDVLRDRISKRSEQLFLHDVVKEAKMLGEMYGWNSEAMTGNIYSLVKKLQQKELTFDQVQEKFITSDWRLAKRQLTWLRRNPHLLWLTLEEAEHYLAQKLA